MFTAQAIDSISKTVFDNRIMLWFSRNGLIGFATELLRYAHDWDKIAGSHRHLEPVKIGGDIVQEMGVFLTPDSNEIILSFDDFTGSNIDEIINKANKI